MDTLNIPHNTNRGPIPKVYVSSALKVKRHTQYWRNISTTVMTYETSMFKPRITSTWFKREGVYTGNDLKQLWFDIEKEIKESNHLLLRICEESFPLTGCYIEVGMALSLGKKVLIYNDDVILDKDSLKPLGNWANHPNVKFISNIEEAFICESTYQNTQAIQN